MPRARRAALLAVALALLGAGCAKDLELPPSSTAPVLAGLTPASAYAGQLVRLRGSGLEADPAANVVTFAAATARGLRFDGAALVVRVPEDAGSGPVIVTNRRGTSAPFGAFDYLGLGEPRRRALTSGLPVLHAPTAVLGVGGDVFVDSAVYEGLLSSADGAFSTPRADLSTAADWAGALFGATRGSTTAALWRVTAAGGARGGQVEIPFYPTALVALRGVDLLVALDSGGSRVAAFDLGTLDPILAATEVAGIGAYFAAADVRDGRAVVVAYDETFSAVTLALLDFTDVRGGGAMPAATLLADGFDPALESRLAVAVTAAAGNGLPAGEPLAAVTLAGGDLRVARLGLAPAFVGTIETFSTAAVAGLAGAATVPVVLATRPEDGLSVGADLQQQRLLWSVPGNDPGPASSAGDVALVAHRGDDDVSVVSLRDGARVARVSFDVAPDRGMAGSWAGALAFLPRDPAASVSEDQLFFASGRFPGLLRFSAGSRTASCIQRVGGLGPLAALPGEAALWVARDGSPPALELLRDRGAAAPVTVPLPGLPPPTHLAASGPSLAVGHGGRALSLVDASGLAGTIATSGDGLVGLGFTPDGEVWDVLQTLTRTEAQRWDPAQLGTDGAAAAARWHAGGAAESAVWLEDGLWLLGQGTSGAEALLLGPDLAVARTVRLAGDAPVAAVPSPNGRLLVERPLLGGAANQTVLRFYRADPELGFPLVDTLVVDGIVEGLTFDGTGERLWIVTRAPDRVLLVD